MTPPKDSPEFGAASSRSRNSGSRRIGGRMAVFIRPLRRRTSRIGTGPGWALREGCGEGFMAPPVSIRPRNSPRAEAPVSRRTAAHGRPRGDQSSGTSPSSARACAGVAIERPARPAHAASASIIGPLPLARSPSGR
jgi:hypothetical protein